MSFGYVSIGQTPIKSFSESSFDESYYNQFGINKIIPNEIRQQVLTALSYYPNLKDVNIIFRFKKKKTPLTARPTFWSVFKKKGRRTYLITLSTNSNIKFSSILFNNLPYNAQIGVIGHEIGHIATYKDMHTFGFFGIAFGMTSSKYIDKFEFNTDLTVIEKGLGYQLYAWSVYVREALNINKWKGVNTSYLESQEEKIQTERYMNPRTIEKYIKSNPLYNQLVF